MKLELGCRTICTHCKSVRYTNYPYREAIVYSCPDCTNKNMSNYYCKYCQEAVIDNWHDSTHTCKKWAYIIQREDNMYECLCGATYTHYQCRCTEWCKLPNMIDVKGNLIK